MLTNQDIQKLVGLLATKEDVRELKRNIDDLRENIQGLSVAVDGLAKSVDDLRIEYAAVLGKLDRHERWIKQIAEKVGVQLEAM